MTDNEIIKALEWATGIGGDEYTGDLGELCADVLDLINRQKAEIETLKAELKFYKDNYLALAKEWQEYPSKTVVGNNCEIHAKTDKDYDNLIAEIKAEAIKEFAEILKDRSKINIFDSVNSEGFVYESEIDNLVKEMTEEK